jgi:hypothetical protein
MTAGVLCGAAVSYGLIQMTRSGDILEMTPHADLTPWIIVVCLSMFAMLMTMAWVRFGRGICTVVPAGCVVAAGLANQAGHNRLIGPLILLAAGCVIACAMATVLEDRMRRPGASS